MSPRNRNCSEKYSIHVLQRLNYDCITRKNRNIILKAFLQHFAVVSISVGT